MTARFRFGLLGLVAMLFVFSLFRMVVVSAPPIDPNHPFDTNRTIERLQRILGDESPHPVDSAASDGVIKRLVEEIQTLGFEPEVMERFHCDASWTAVCARVRNVRFWVTEPGDDAIMLASHHDSVPTGPGAADDGMGVAISLELAHLFRNADLDRPLLILITDAEEVGLLGASAFVKHDPVARRIGAVISLEARGNAGTANMFETGHPNGRDLAAIKGWGSRPVSNSMATDIYRRMPNGTDLTQYLTLDIDAANYAIIGRHDAYHTLRDTIANLDPASVFHMGRSAYDAVIGFADTDEGASDENRIYTDLLRVTVISLPERLALPLLVAALIVFLILANRQAGRARWRAFLWAPLLLLLGTGLAWAGTWIIDAIRPERGFATAHPWALRGWQTGLSLIGATVAVGLLFKAEDWKRFLFMALAWFSALGLVLTLVVPGVAILLIPPLVVAILGGLALDLSLDRTGKILIGGAGLLLLAIVLPAAALGETALFIENAWPFVMTLLWVCLFSIPLFIGRGSVAPVLLALTPITIAFGLLSAVLPAYSKDGPQGRNITHIEGDGFDESLYILSGRDPVPDMMNDVSPFEARRIETLSVMRAVASAPPLPGNPLQVSQTTETGPNGKTIGLSVAAPQSDEIELIFEDPLDAQSVTVNGTILSGLDKPMRRLSCWGRSCRDLDIRILTQSDDPVALAIHSHVFGLGEESASLLAARPDWSLPKHDGDRRTRRVELSLDTIE